MIKACQMAYKLVTQPSKFLTIYKTLKTLYPQSPQDPQNPQINIL